MAARTVFIDTALSDYQSLATQYDAGLFNVVLLDGASPHVEQIQNWMKTNGASAADINIVSASASVNGSFTPRVVFVDSSIADLDTVIAGVPANATVVVLDASRDGVQQIHDYLAANGGQVGAIDIVTDLASIDVVSHGAPGEVMLGSTVLNADTLAQYSSQLAEIGSHLTAGADLLLYGCDVASGTVGQQFISALAAATGADVAASTDLTGGAAAGGDWTLEASTGTIETAALNIAGYDALLGSVAAVTSATLSADTGSSSSDYITNVASQTITFNGTINGNGNTKVWVSTDGVGTNRTSLDVSTITVNGQTRYTVTPVTLLDGANRTIQFWDGPLGNGNGNNGTLLFTRTYTLDATLTTPTLSLRTDSGTANDGRTNDAALLFSSLDSDATRVIKVDNNIVTSYVPGSLAEGSHTVNVTDTDTAGNTKTVAIAFTLDTKAPTPSVALASDTGKSASDGITSNAALTLAALESGATRVIKVDGTVVTAYDASTLADGQHTVTVTDTDAAGNAGTAAATFTLDTKAPTPSVTLGTDTGTSNTDGLTNNAGLNLSALEAGATRVIKVDGNVVGAYDPAALADGAHTVEVTDTDAAGNTAKSSVSFTLDTTLGTPTVKLAQDTGSSSTDGVTSNAALNIGAPDAGAVRVIRVDNQVVASYDPASLADGAHTVSVTDSDAAGNTRNASAAFTLDTKAPVTSATLVKDTGSSGTDGLTSNAGLSFGALESGATRVITVDGTAVAAYDPAALADGQHTVQVADTDAAGNVGRSSVVFTLDTALPAPTVALASDTGKSGSDGITSNAALTIGTLEAGATRVITVDGNVVTAYDPATLADGQHTVEVADTDGAGNTGKSSASFTLDTKAPVPTAALATDTGTSATDGLTSNAALSFGALENGATRVIKVDGTVVTAYDPTKLADGQHTVEVADTDAAGNVGKTSVAFKLDTAAPAPTAPLAHDTGSSATDGITSNAALGIGALEAGATRVITVDGTVVTAYDPAALADGQHTVELADTDGAGNTGKSSTTFTLDTKAPATSAALVKDSGNSNTDGITNDAGVSFGALENGATRVITVDGTVVTAYDPSKLADGAHTVEVADTDAAGNIGKSSVAFMLDTKAPTPTSALAQDTGRSNTDGVTSNAALTLGALESGATRVITVDGTVVTDYDPAKLADGQHTVELADTDAAGNTGKTSTTFTLDTRAPVPTAALAADTGTSGTDGLTKDAGLSFGTLEAGATRVITVDGTVVDAYDAGALADGKHTVELADTDAAGNVGKTSVTFTLDTAAPTPTAPLAHDTGRSGADGITSDAALSIGALEAGASRVIKVDGTVVTAYDPTALADGQHTVELADTDAAGNTGKSTTTFTLDTKAPVTSAALTADTGSNDKDGITSNAGVGFGALENGATRVITVDGTVVTAYDPSKLAEGHHTVEVADTDAAGNVGKSSVAFTLDTKAPTPTSALAQDTGTSNTDGVTSNAALTLGTLEAGATRVITVDGTVVTAYDPAKLADGQHTVELADTDAAGNTGKSSISFSLDTKAPVPTAALATDTGTSNTDGLTSNAGLTLGALEAGASRVITVDGQVVGSYDPGSLADGKHTVELADTDVAGNVGKTSLTFTLDTAAPAPSAPLAHDTGASITDGITKDAALNIAALETGASRVIKLDGTVVTAYDPTQLADGQHTVELADTDAAGNTGKSSTTFILDTKLPVTSAGLSKDTGNSNTDGITSDAGVSFGTLESGATRVITVDGTVVTAYDPAKLADGQHTVEVADTDAAGNTGKSSVAFMLDTKAPIPGATLARDTGNSSTDGLTSNAALNLTALESGASRVITVDGTVVTAYDPTTLADGQHTVELADTDAAGNIGKSSISFSLDTKAPAPTAALTNDTGSSNKDGLTSDAALGLGALENGATRVITVDGSVVGAYDAARLANGQHTVEIADTDGAGNVGKTSLSFTLDTQAPAPTVKLATDSGTNAADGLTNNAGLSFAALENGATRVIKVDGNTVTAYDPAALAEGQHTVEVTDTDGAGNAGKASATFTLDSKGPVFSSAASATVAENIGERQVVYKALAADAHGASFSLGGVDAAKFEIAADGSVTLKENPNYEAVNAYAFTVVATDNAGNHTDQAVALGITNVNEAPVATSISKSTIENAQISFQVADYISDPDAGDRLGVSLGSATATLSWANTDPAAPRTIINPVTKAAVDLSTLSVKAILSADGTTVTLTPPAELDWLATGQAVKASISYTVTDAAGLKSQDTIDFLMNGSTNDKGVNLSGGNGDDTLVGNGVNNAEDVLNGNNGNDTLSGFGGTDALYGGNGDDKLSGGAGIDYLYGDSGNDTLDGGTEGDFIFGGKGNDVLTGGAGPDKFVFAPLSGSDRITDFKISEGDKLYFADFFQTAITVDAFLQKYVTDTGNDLLINLQGTQIVVVGVQNVSDLTGVISFGMPV